MRIPPPQHRSQATAAPSPLSAILMYTCGRLVGSRAPNVSEEVEVGGAVLVISCWRPLICVVRRYRVPCRFFWCNLCCRGVSRLSEVRARELVDKFCPSRWAALSEYHVNLAKALGIELSPRITAISAHTYRGSSHLPFHVRPSRSVLPLGSLIDCRIVFPRNMRSCGKQCNVWQVPDHLLQSDPTKCCPMSFGDFFLPPWRLCSVSLDAGSSQAPSRYSSAVETITDQDNSLLTAVTGYLALSSLTCTYATARNRIFLSRDLWYSPSRLLGEDGDTHDRRSHTNPNWGRSAQQWVAFSPGTD
jgi:hypothetical protein